MMSKGSSGLDGCQHTDSVIFATEIDFRKD